MIIKPQKVPNSNSSRVRGIGKQGLLTFNLGLTQVSGQTDVQGNIMTEQEFMELRRMLQLAHHVPGRLRLKFDPRILGHPVAPYLASLAKNGASSGITGTRLNLLARSLVIEYDTERMDPAVLDCFLTSRDMEQVRESAKKVAALFGMQLSLS